MPHTIMRMRHTQKYPYTQMYVCQNQSKKMIISYLYYHTECSHVKIFDLRGIIALHKRNPKELNKKLKELWSSFDL